MALAVGVPTATKRGGKREREEKEKRAGVEERRAWVYAATTRCMVCTASLGGRRRGRVCLYSTPYNAR